MGGKNSPMTDNDIAYYRELLDTLQTALEDTQEAADDAAKVVDLDQARFGRLSRMGDMQAQAISLAVNRQRDIQLQRIQGAYQRMERGIYGLCLGCQVPIDRQRLEIDPTAFHCVACAEKAEKKRR